MKQKLFVQHVLVEADNTCPWVDKFVTKRKLTLERAARYYEKNHSFDWESDGITFISEPEAIKL